MATLEILVSEGGVGPVAMTGTLVTVGNAHQPFARLLKAVDTIAHQLPQPVTMQHGHTAFQSKHCRMRNFLPMDEFIELVASVKLVITHAGAGSILQAIDANQRPVVMPRRAMHQEHVDDHQVELAQAFSTRGLIVLAMDTDQLGSAVQQALATATADRPLGDDPLLALVKDTLAAHDVRLIEKRAGKARRLFT